MSSRIKNIIVDTVCILLVVLFVYTAVSKLLDYDKFKLQVGQSPLLTRFSGLIVLLVPMTEVIVSIILVFPRWRIMGLYAAFSLMIMFTAYIIAITRFSSYIPCSCGGVIQGLSWNQHLILNLAFCVLALTGIFLQYDLNYRQPLIGQKTPN